MKRVIEGVRFDTEKAVKVGENSSTLPVTDFSWWSAALYRTPRSGRYFLAGEGGPMTRFARSNGDTVGYGEKIIPMSRAEALEWAEHFLDPDTVENEFSDFIEDA
jgi:hypothetical protein